MSFLYYLAMILFMILCVVLCVVILVQESKSSGLGASFGGMLENLYSVLRQQMC